MQKELLPHSFIFAWEVPDKYEKKKSDERKPDQPPEQAPIYKDIF